MVNYSEIERIINQLIDSGSEIDNLSELKVTSAELIRSDKSLEEVLKEIGKEVSVLTEEFLSKKNVYETSFITGISTGIYLPDHDNNGEFKFKVVGGTTSRDNGTLVDEETQFDIASITKLFTLVLAFKLQEMGLIDLNKEVRDVNEDVQNLEDFTFLDLLLFHGELYTKGNMREAKTPMEAYERLKSVFLKSNSREKSAYTDFGAMVIADTIEKVISKELGREMSYDEIMDEFLLKPLGLSQTTYRPNKENVAGNANALGLPHDPKAKAFGRPSGHAGLFTTSEDLMHFAKGLIIGGYLTEKDRSLLSQITYPGSSHGYLGTFVKNPEGSTFAPKEFSTDSYASQGYTGSVAMFDQTNMIHSSILVNAIQNTDNKELITNDKPSGFMPEFKAYQREVVKRILLIYIAKKYYNEYCNSKENVEEVEDLNVSRR